MRPVSPLRTAGSRTIDSVVAPTHTETRNRESSSALTRCGLQDATASEFCRPERFTRSAPIAEDITKSRSAPPTSLQGQPQPEGFIVPLASSLSTPTVTVTGDLNAAAGSLDSRSGRTTTTSPGTATGKRTAAARKPKAHPDATAGVDSTGSVLTEEGTATTTTKRRPTARRSTPETTAEPTVEAA